MEKNGQLSLKCFKEGLKILSKITGIVKWNQRSYSFKESYNPY